ncbi:MAG: serine dehydratase subunit alpha family protein [Clostridium sp.]
MHALTELIKSDMKPALGVTEPGAIAFAVSTAKAHMKGDVKKVNLRLNSGMYKNAFTCGIPGTSEVGNYYAAALGAVAADPKKGLECLEGIGKAEEEAAGEMIKAGMISVSMSSITSRIFIEATVTGETSEAVVTIQDAHTNITKITENGTVVFEKEAKAAQESKEATPLIHQYTLAQMVEYVNTVSAQELDFIKEAYKVNYELLQEGLKSPKTTYGPYLLKKNGGVLVSEDERKTASLFCNGAIEARVIGLSKPAMSITGSGAHGIIATMPLYAVYKINNYTDEQLLRATALSYLVCMYIKEYSGKLSAFCGCAIAAGTGMACALAWLKGAGAETMEKVINNMASSITGMICDGGNQGCTMKGIVAVDAAFDSVELAMDDVYIYNAHGINGATPEETMHNMGLIASPGMTGTEKTIVDILDGKNK